MMSPTRAPGAAVLISALLPLAGAGLLAQTPAVQKSPPAEASARQEATPATPAKAEWFAVGFRVRSFPLPSLSVMADDRRMSTVIAGRTASDWSFNTASRSPKYGGGPAVELRLTPSLRLTAELLFDRLRYEKVIDVYSGTDDPATGHDERSHANTTENTKARLWDLPVLLHYRAWRSPGFLSNLSFSGGLTARTTSSIRTTTQITNPDGSSSTNYLPALPAKRTLVGGVVGLGLRFVDDFNIKVTPEVRYTRWTGATFAFETTRSPKNQLEFGIGFTR